MMKVQIFKTLDQELALFEKYISQKRFDGTLLQILEAGCGRHWPLNLKGLSYVLTGVDLDKSALDFRKKKFNDLHEIIIGDLHTVDLEEKKYDVIYNSFVLEHVHNAELILENFSKWLKPGGLLIMRIPDRNSVHGFITRFTPLWFHIFCRKYIDGFQNAGKPGYGPYPIFYDPVVSRAGIHQYCQKNRFAIKEEYGYGFYLNRKGIIPVLIRLFVKSISLLSLGKLAWQYDSLTYILEKE